MMLFDRPCCFLMLPLFICLALGVHAQNAARAPYLVKDIYPNQNDGFYDDAGEIVSNGGNKVFCNAKDTTQGMQLWISDGTDAGTVKLTHFVRDSRYNNATTVSRLCSNNQGSVYFSVAAANHGLWLSDGTPGGTRAVLDLTSSTTTGAVTPLKMMGTRLLFTAATNQGPELWSTDGTPAGTQVLAKGSSFELMPAEAGDLRQFFVCNWDSAPTLWLTDGTPAGTRLIKTLGNSGYRLSPLAPGIHQGVLYFGGDDAYNYQAGDLWRSDGTTSGTFVLRTLAPKPYWGTYATPLFLGDTMYFVSDPYFSHQDLWRSDGSAPGTWKFDFNNYPLDPFKIVHLQILKQKLYIFTVNTSGGGLYVSDGATPAYVTGSYMDFIDIYHDISQPAFCQSTDQFMIFAGHNSLWRSDGTSTGTLLLSALSIDTERTFIQVPGQNAWLFTNKTSDFGNELWWSDGTVQGTKLLADVIPGSGGAYPRALAISGDRLFFTARDAAHGRELWAMPLSRLQNAVAGWRRYE